MYGRAAAVRVGPTPHPRVSKKPRDREAGGTDSSTGRGMRYPPFLFAVLGSALLAACDQSTSPTIAGVATGGTNASSAAPLIIRVPNSFMTVGGQMQVTTNAPLALSNQLQWSSSQPGVAAVSPTG